MNINEKSYSVSAVIPAYNAEKYIGRAIDSVLAQSHSPDEVIVVDDGSTDGTGEVVKGYGSSVRYIRQENAGASVARNAGIEAARGEWIAFLDADDYWLKDKLKLQIEHLRRNKDLVWSCGNFVIRTPDGKTDKPGFKLADLEKLLDGKEYFEDCLRAYLVGFYARTSTAIIKRQVFDEAGMFLVGQLWAQDVDMFLRIAYRWPKVGFVAEPIGVYYWGMPGCITDKNRYLVRQRCDLISRHLELSDGEGRLGEFQPLVGEMLRQWMRGIMRDNRFADVSEMVNRFDALLPKSLKTEMRLRMALPRTAPFCFRVYFGLKKLLRGLRKA